LFVVARIYWSFEAFSKAFAGIGGSFDQETAAEKSMIPFKA
jgi:hypothetical protein